jgi:hypothetical protein
MSLNQFLAIELHPRLHLRDRIREQFIPESRWLFIDAQKWKVLCDVAGRPDMSSHADNRIETKNEEAEDQSKRR